MRLRSLLWAGLISTVLLSGCSVFSGEKDVVKKSPLPKIEIQFSPYSVWSQSVGSGTGDFYSLLSPTFIDGVIYAADRQGTVRAMDLNSGKSLWQVNIAKRKSWSLSRESVLLSGGVAVDEDAVYLGSERAKVYALNRANGELLWQSDVAGEVMSSPVVDSGLVLINTSNGLLQALNHETGKIQWTVNLDVPVLSVRGESTPAVAHGAAVVGSDNGRVSAIMLSQGQMIWQQRIAIPKGTTEIARLSDVDMTPVIDAEAGIVYVLGYNGDLVALELRSGEIIWRRDFGSVHNLVLDNDRLYLVDKEDRIIALSTNGGIVLWKQSDLLYRQLTSPVLYQGYLVVGDQDGYLHWLEREDGRFVAQHKVSGSGLLSSPKVMDDYLIVQAKNGKVYAFTQSKSK